ncbi:hypothetical protein EJ04DRAFT_477483 [Polyplosphaeria fusca]|uniref:Uncharacterized protein n=1 Tax=Polyplosphaeria fusca TaxID=682080 RepID=A0A9P4QP26_9PLEO|nr:hypothetical protein EJ04DRAFT_477483 [Polyplosphaeria fusca]
MYASTFPIGYRSGHPDQVRLQRSYRLGSCYLSVARSYGNGLLYSPCSLGYRDRGQALLLHIILPTSMRHHAPIAV